MALFKQIGQVISSSDNTCSFDSKQLIGQSMDQLKVHHADFQYTISDGLTEITLSERLVVSFRRMA